MRVFASLPHAHLYARTHVWKVNVSRPPTRDFSFRWWNVRTPWQIVAFALGAARARWQMNKLGGRQSCKLPRYAARESTIAPDVGRWILYGYLESESPSLRYFPRLQSRPLLQLWIFQSRSDDPNKGELQIVCESILAPGRCPEVKLISFFFQFFKVDRKMADTWIISRVTAISMIQALDLLGHNSRMVYRVNSSCLEIDTYLSFLSSCSSDFFYADQPVKSNALDASTDFRNSCPPVVSVSRSKVLVDQNRLAHLRFWELNLLPLHRRSRRSHISFHLNVLKVLATDSRVTR